MPNILICDDERDIVSALKIYLSSEGYTIFEAYSKLGRRNQYMALATEADYQAAQAQTLLNKLYEGIYKNAQIQKPLC